MKKLLLFLREWVAEPWYHLLFVLVMIVSLWFSLGFLTIEKTSLAYLENQFIAKLPPKTLRITPKPARTVSLFGVTLARPKGSVINDATLRAIRRLPGVRQVYPFLSCQVPMQVQISLFGLGYQSDVVAIGVPWEFIQSELPSSYRSRFRNWQPNQPVTALLPILLLDMYNQTLAKPNQLPTITEAFARGQKLRLVFGRSSLKSVGTPMVVDAELAGFSRKVGEIALILPLPVVEHFNRLFGYTESEYSTVLVEATDHDHVLSLSQEITRMGLVVESESGLSREILSLRKTIHLVFRVIQALIWGLCGVAIGLAAFLAGLKRQSYYHLLRILGESRLSLLVMILSRYILLAGIAFSLATLLFRSLVRRLPSLIPTLPLQLVTTPDMLFFYLAVGIALLPSFSLLLARPSRYL